jgi:hypothetical protein
MLALSDFSLVKNLDMICLVRLAIRSFSKLIYASSLVLPSWVFALNILQILRVGSGCCCFLLFVGEGATAVV